MNGIPSIALRAAAAALILCFGVSRMPAQTPATPPTAQTPATTAPAAAAPAQESKEAEEDDNNNPFAPEPAPALPAGMMGSDANDPRAKLKAGMYDAGEASMGLKHLLLLKKPDAFQLGATDPDDPKVQKTIGQQLDRLQRVRRHAGADPHGDQAVGRKSRPHLLHLDEASDHQARRGQQNY